MKISSNTVLKIICGFTTSLAIAGAYGTYYFYHQNLQTQSTLAQQSEELENAGAKLKETLEKLKEAQSKNEESLASIEKFSVANKELSAELEQLTKQVATYEAMQKRPKSKGKN